MEDNWNPPAGGEVKEGSNIPKIDVMIVAIHNDTIARYKTIVAEPDSMRAFFEIEIFSTMRAVLDEALAPVMIMDLGAASTKPTSLKGSDSRFTYH